jgi:O-antigen/teichoic acid export membrane protein
MRDGTALGASAAISAVAGMVTWVIAARLMPQAEVGRAAAFVNAFLLVASFAQLNLGVGLLRWLPRAGGRAVTLVGRATLAVVATGVVGASVYLVLPGSGAIFAASTGSSTPSLVGWAVFVAATVGWVLVQVQDFTLVGLSRAWWTPSKNTLMVAARVGMLVGIGTALSARGVVFSWVAPVLACAAVMVVVTMVFARRAGRPATVGGQLPSTREARGFLGPTYLGTVGMSLLYHEVPLLVIFRFGPQVEALFFIAWQAITVIDTVGEHFVFSLASGIAREPGRTRELARRARFRLMVFFLPALGLGVAIAGPALSIFGASYTAAAPALRILLIGVAFRLIVVHALGLRQAVGDAVGFARLQWATTVLVLAAVLAVPAGATGDTGVLVPVALAYLGIQVVTAVFLLASGRGGIPGAARRGLLIRAGMTLVGLPRRAFVAAAVETATAAATATGHTPYRPRHAAPDPEAPTRPLEAVASGEARTVRGDVVTTPGLEEQGAPPGPAGLAAPVEPRSRWTFRRLAPWLPALLAVAALGLLPLVAARTDLDALGGFGLAGVLPVWAWVSIAFAVGGCVLEIRRRRPRPLLLVALTGVLIVCTTGLPSIVEPAARLPVAWLHSGFVGAIAHGGSLPHGVDSRFSWAGFFSQWAWIEDAAGGVHLDAVLRWAPPVIVAIWAVGVYAIARPLLAGTRGPWVAVWLFLGANWIEQDYFSPQATAIVLLIAVLACALGPLATRRGDLAGHDGWPVATDEPGRLSLLRRAAVRALTPVRRPDVASGRVLLCWAVVAACVLAVVVDHQSTPFVIAAQLVILAVAGRFWGRRLVLLLILAEATWFVLGATDFWTAHLGLATSGAGGGALGAGLLGRLHGDPGQVSVKLARILMALATWGLALVGARVRWRRERDLALVLVAFVPIVMAGLSSYGGEVFMRVLLYGLPVLAVLGTDALRRFADRFPRAGPRLLAGGMLVLFGLLVVIRGGNDSYLLVRPQQVTLARHVLSTAPPNSTVLGLTNQGLPDIARVRDVTQTGYKPGCDSLADHLRRCTRQEKPDVIMVFPQMEADGIFNKGRAPGWTRHAVARLVGTGHYRVTYESHRHGFTAVLRRTS